MRQGELDQPKAQEKPARSDARSARSAPGTKPGRPAADSRPSDFNPKELIQGRQPLQPATDSTKRLRVSQQDSPNRDTAHQPIPSGPRRNAAPPVAPAPNVTAQSEGRKQPAVHTAIRSVSRTGGAAGGRPNAAQTVGQILARDGATGSSRDAQPIMANGPRSSEQNSSRPRSADPSSKPPNPNAAEKSDSGDSIRRPEFARLMRMVRLNIGQKASSATIRMNPPELGRLRIDVQMQNDQLSIRVETDNPQSRSLFAQRADELIESLRSQQINVDRVEVTVRNTPMESAVAAVEARRSGASESKSSNRSGPTETGKNTQANGKRSMQTGDRGGAGLSIRA